MTEAKMKTAAEILNELSKITYRFDLWPATEPETRCGRTCWLRPGDPMVWEEREHPPAKNAPRRSGLGMCIACGKAALEKHYALVFDVRGRAEREAERRASIFVGVDWAKGESQTVATIVASPRSVGKRILAACFWETGHGQVAVTSVSEEADGALQINAVAVDGPKNGLEKVAMRLEMGQEPEHVGWRIAEHFTAEEVAERLGLEPFDVFARRRGNGRGSGRTTKMLCQAISLATRGYSPSILVHHEAYAKPFRTWFRGLAEMFGPCVNRITVVADRELWLRRSCLLKDHHAETKHAS